MSARDAADVVVAVHVLERAAERCAMEATALLRKKDGERTQVKAEIRALEDIKAKGYQGRLRVQLLPPKQQQQQPSADDAVATPTLTFTVSPVDSGDEESDGCWLLKSTSVSLLLRVQAGADVVYDADFDCRELSAEGYTIAEVEGKNRDGSGGELKFSVKVSYDDLDKAIAHKATELEEIQEQVQALGASLRGAAGVGGKGSNVHDVDEELPSHGGVPTSVAVLNTAGFVAALLLEYRSFWLFGASALGIYLYGDYASL
jgi:hypothetical protein